MALTLGSKNMARNCSEAVEGKHHHVSAGLIDMGVADSDSHTAFSKNPDSVTNAFIDLLYLMDASVIVCTSSSFAGLNSPETEVNIMQHHGSRT